VVQQQQEQQQRRQQQQHWRLMPRPGLLQLLMQAVALVLLLLEVGRL
jgi:hypothetical protein